MAEFPNIDLQSQLIARGLDVSNPTDTYIDFAQKIAENRQKQAEMETALKAAQLKFKQSKEAADKGFNPELVDMIPKEQALAQLNVILKAKKIKMDQALVDEWYATLPQLVNRKDIEAFATTAAKTPTGSSIFIRNLTKSMKDADGVMRVYNVAERRSDGVQTDRFDPETGQAVFPDIVENAETPEEKVQAQAMLDRAIPQLAGMESKYSTQRELDTKKSWKQLQKEINISNAPNARAIGMAAVNNVRAKRALTRLQTSKVTPQDLEIVANDLAAIFKGGVPDIESQRHQRYLTIKGKVAEVAQFLLSKPAEMNVPEIVDRLKTITDELIDVDNAVISAYIDSVATGYEDYINQDPARFARMVNAQLRLMDKPEIDLKAVENMDEVPISQATVDSLGESSAEKPVKSNKEKPVKVEKVVPKYTVEE